MNFLFALVCALGSLLHPARILRRVRRERSYILHSGLITDRVIRLRCNPSVAARRACGIKPLPFPTLRDLQKKTEVL